MLPRRFLGMLFVPTFLIALGTVTYHFLEGLGYFDALYFTVVTLTTLGYGDIYPHSTGGKAFTIFLALSGIFTLFYVAAEVIRSIVSGEVQTHLKERRMEQSLADLKDHFIVCGYGRMGRFVCHEFSKEGLPFVIIERQDRLLADFQIPQGIALPGDATADEVLKKAGVDRARALITVAASDADNLYITMSARLLNDKLFIVARAESEQAGQKLIRAGATKVVSPYVIGGSRVAQAVLRPNVVDFIELATRTEYLELQIEETQISPQSPLAGANLKDSRLRQDRGIIIVAIKKSGGQMVYNPPPEAIMEPGDILITLGHREQLDQLEKLASGAA